jgi:polyphosphate:AMP phosphotransferase
MFEAAEFGRHVGKAEYEAEVPKLREGLLEAQRELLAAKIPLLILVSGADGAGKGETVKRLLEWFDPRGLETSVFGPLTDEERDRPQYWRFWRALPPRGRIGILFGSWYTDPIVRRVYGGTGDAALERQLARIAFFEEMLAEDGALIVKLWLHLSRKAQKRRLKALQKDPSTRWRVTPLDWKHFKLYKKFKRVSELAIRRTDTAHAPWTIIEAVDDRYRELAVGRMILDAMTSRLAAREPSGTPAAASTRAAKLSMNGNILAGVDLAAALKDKEYDRKLPKLQGRLARLSRAAWEKKISSVIVFEGWDAAGKGGSIRRLTEAMDARLYRVVPIAAPSDEERAHHYLWRFWRHIPRAGLVTIFDRSWYGRVLVERVESLIGEGQWRRAYLEINDFESQLAEHGIVLAKIWIHISKDEQLRRFQERKDTGYKQHKITDEDWRNREKWAAYEKAVNEMILRTSTREAPWTLVAGNDKRHARIRILDSFCDRLEKAL